MRQPESLIPNFAQIFGAAVGSVTSTPVMPARPASGPIDREIRRINSAHKPEVREVASDNEIGRDIVDADARQLALQKRSVRKNAQRHAVTAANAAIKAPIEPVEDDPA